MSCPEFDAVIAEEQKILKALRTALDGYKASMQKPPLKDSAAANAVYDFWDQFVDTWSDQNKEVTGDQSAKRDERLEKEEARLKAMRSALAGEESFWTKALSKDIKATHALRHGTC